MKPETEEELCNNPLYFDIEEALRVEDTQSTSTSSSSSSSSSSSLPPDVLYLVQSDGSTSLAFTPEASKHAVGPLSRREVLPVGAGPSSGPLSSLIETNVSSSSISSDTTTTTRLRFLQAETEWYLSISSDAHTAIEAALTTSRIRSVEELFEIGLVSNTPGELTFIRTNETVSISRYLAAQERAYQSIRRADILRRSSALRRAMGEREQELERSSLSSASLIRVVATCHLFVAVLDIMSQKLLGLPGLLALCGVFGALQRRKGLLAIYLVFLFYNVIYCSLTLSEAQSIISESSSTAARFYLILISLSLFASFLAGFVVLKLLKVLRALDMLALSIILPDESIENTSINNNINNTTTTTTIDINVHRNVSQQQQQQQQQHYEQEPQPLLFWIFSDRQSQPSVRLSASRFGRRRHHVFAAETAISLQQQQQQQQQRHQENRRVRHTSPLRVVAAIQDSQRT